MNNIIEILYRLYDIVFDRMTKWYLQIDPIFWLTGYYQEQKHFIKKITDFSKTVIEFRNEKLKTSEFKSKINLMNTQEDSVGNTDLSVIDRFILSRELSDAELIDETFTVFTSVSIFLLFKYEIQTDTDNFNTISANNVLP